MELTFLTLKFLLSEKKLIEHISPFTQKVHQCVLLGSRIYSKHTFESSSCLEFAHLEFTRELKSNTFSWGYRGNSKCQRS